ncbi:MAG TPA: tetratricopeptide repeat protein [Polyangia bacterium]|nr:tetratricopeptide repeat protein [Polyangia bacterium]
MRFVVALALAHILGAVPGAQAAGSEDSVEGNKVAARAEWRQANVAYNLGHYDEAAKHFEAAYTIIQDSAFLFNIAQSYRMGGKLDQALDRYRAFLRTSSADAANRDTAERFIAEIKRKLDEKPAPIAPPEAAIVKEAAPPAPALAPPLVPAEATAAGPSSAAPPAAAPAPAAPAPAMPVAIPLPSPVESTTTLTTAPAAPEPASAGQPIYKTWWFWTGVGAVVVAGTVTAILFAYRPSSSACSGTGLSCVEVK